MPLQSEAQRRFMWSKHPEIAKRWAHEHSGDKSPPKHKRKGRGTDWKHERKKEMEHG